LYSIQGGDVLIFRRDTCVFRACIPICTNGVKGIVALPDGQMLCGGGDGSITKLVGSDMAWSLAKQIKVNEGGITSMSLSHNMAEVVVGCSSGTLMRCMITDLQYFAVGVSHTSEISCIVFGTESATIFATGTRAGDIRIWDITDYASLASTRLPKSGAVTSLAMTMDGSIVSGWQDGFIRCHDGTLNRQLWLIPGAHRGTTTTLALHSNSNSSLSFLASGGDDGTVRVWRLGNRELVTQYTEHTKPVSKVLIDVQKPNILHSIGADGSVLSFDLKAGRRLISHIINGGLMTDMTQRQDNELELITADVIGRLMHWDIDYREAVLVIQDPTRTAMRKCSVSPSGRFLAFAGDDMVLKVLEIKSGQVISLGQGHSSAIKALSWTPDERQLVTGGDDCCLCVWNFFLGGLDVALPVTKSSTEDAKHGGR
jgi:cilia- and flagella-associated protein 52